MDTHAGLPTTVVSYPWHVGEPTTELHTSSYPAGAANQSLAFQIGKTNKYIPAGVSQVNES